MTQAVAQPLANLEEKVGISAKVMSAYIYIFLVGSIFGNYASASLNQFVLWILGPAVLFFILSNNISKISKLPLEIKLYGFLLPISLVGLVNVQDSDGYFRYLKVILSNWLLMIMVFSSIERPNEIKLLLKAVFLACITIVLLSVFIKDPTQDVTDEYYRLSGVTGNANGVATFSRVGVLLALYYLFSSKGITNRLLYLGIIVFCLNAIILTASRGASANIVLSISMFFMFKRLSGGRLIIALLIIYLVYLAFIAFGEDLLGDTYLYRRITRNESIDDAIESESRLQIYMKTFNLFLENPFLGVGLNQVQYILGKISHTDILDIAAQTGIFGLISYLSIYVNLFKRILSRWLINNTFFYEYSSPFFITLLVSEMIFGLTNPNWFTQLNMFLLAIAVTHYCVLDKQINQRKSNALVKKRPSSFIPN